MAPIYSKNMILVGLVDYFCLVCEDYLKCERDAISHILKPIHLKKLAIIPYVEEFKAERIKKIQNKYFCELCNKVFNILDRVRMHVKEQTHQENKNSNPLERIGNELIAFGKVVISEQSWHSLNDNACAICNVEYDNLEIHKNQHSHVLNLLQLQLEIDSNKNIYRLVGQGSFHCLTCNLVLALDSLTTHFLSIEHKSKYLACGDGSVKTLNKDDQVNKITSIEDVVKLAEILPQKINNEDKSQNINKINSNEEVDKPAEIQQQKINNEDKSQNVNKITSNEDVVKPAEIQQQKINNEDKSQNNKGNETIKSKTKKNKQNRTIDINIDKQKQNKKSSECVDNEICEENICKILGCKDYVTRDENNKTWCILCNWIMDPFKIKSHVEGKHHQTILKLHKKRLNKMTKNTKMDNAIQDDVKIIKNNDSIFENNETIIKNDKTDIKLIGNIETNTAKNDKDDINNDNDKILDNITIFQQNSININFESSAAICKKCNVNVEFNYTAIECHVIEHNKKQQKKSRKTKVLDAGENKVSNRNQNLFTSPVLLKQKEQTMCFTVEKNDSQNPIENILDPSISDEENEDDGYLDDAALDPIYDKIPAEQFVKRIIAVNYMNFTDVIINDEFCINFFSLCFMTPVGENQVSCLLCKVNFINTEFNNHLSTGTHDEAMKGSLVLVLASGETEFIREIPSEHFHCGFCNVFETSWENMETHLKSASHKQIQISLQWRLEIYKEQIETQDFERVTAESMVLDEIVKRMEK